MRKDRLEAFSDGVLAIIITIMVLELKVPHGTGPEALLPLLPVFLSYVLSFIYIGIYWNNHHHMLHATRHVTGGALWANLHLLFWLSLLPFVTGWMGENHVAPLPTALYGLVLFMAAAAYWILAHVLIAAEGADSFLARAIGKDRKGVASVMIYAAAIPLSFFEEWLAKAMYVLVALIWLVPDRRIEKHPEPRTDCAGLAPRHCARMVLFGCREQWAPLSGVVLPHHGAGFDSPQAGPPREAQVPFRPDCGWFGEPIGWCPVGRAAADGRYVKLHVAATTGLSRA